MSAILNPNQTTVCGGSIGTPVPDLDVIMDVQCAAGEYTDNATDITAYTLTAQTAFTHQVDHCATLDNQCTGITDTVEVFALGDGNHNFHVSINGDGTTRCYSTRHVPVETVCHSRYAI